MAINYLTYYSFAFMCWPPNKAWTSCSKRKGYRHFVAINYGGSGDSRWVQLVSVLDGSSRLIVLWSEIKDQTKWNSGWLVLPRDEANPIREYLDLEDSQLDTTKWGKGCLHPSNDSGLRLPIEVDLIRKWFDDES